MYNSLNQAPFITNIPCRSKLNILYSTKLMILLPNIQQNIYVIYMTYLV